MADSLYSPSGYEHSIQQQRVAESQQRQSYQLGVLLRQAVDVKDRLDRVAVV